MPYKEYKLVHGDGSAAERTKKHPFCMSRVHYSAAGDSCACGAATKLDSHIMQIPYTNEATGAHRLLDSTSL